MKFFTSWWEFFTEQESEITPQPGSDYNPQRPTQTTDVHLLYYSSWRSHSLQKQCHSWGTSIQNMSLKGNYPIQAITGPDHSAPARPSPQVPPWWATWRQSKNKRNTQHSARRMEVGNLHNIPLKSVFLMTSTSPQKENIYRIFNISINLFQIWHTSTLHGKHRRLPYIYLHDNYPLCLALFDILRVDWYCIWSNI